MNTSDKLTAKFSIGIQKRASAVFEAIVNPDIMRHYFISKSSGRMEAGAILQWTFPEFETVFPVTVKEVVNNEKIVFVWDPQSVVTIRLNASADDTTVVHVEETGHSSDIQGIEWAIGQTGGWANFLACMKAYLEHGIHLRKGAFDFMKNDAK